MVSMNLDPYFMMQELLNKPKCPFDIQFHYGQNSETLYQILYDSKKMKEFLKNTEKYFKVGYEIPEKFKDENRDLHTVEDLIDFYRMVHDGIGVDTWIDEDIERFLIYV